METITRFFRVEPQSFFLLGPRGTGKSTFPRPNSPEEEDRRRRFVLTGSSPRKLKRDGADMLAGRALLKRMHPFVAGELGKAFSLPGALRHGVIPVVVGGPDPAGTFHSYVDLYLREEIQAEGLTRNIGNFTRFLEAASFSHGSPFPFSNISREGGAERKTVEGDLSILA